MYTQNEVELLRNCNLCPRNCNANRFSKRLGYCKSGADFHISSICVHKGEEPVISGKKGICNVFFPHCNLQCIYCQNHEISRNCKSTNKYHLTFNEVIDQICTTLQHTENILGFVSPSHYIPQMLSIIRGVNKAGIKPIIVYNTNGYDKVESLQMLEGIVDVYLPDFKYMDSVLAKEYSDAENYPRAAMNALKEMYRQKGSVLIVNDEGIAESGIIVRHLVLPGNAAQSIEVLKAIAEEVSTGLHISLMSQYYPALPLKEHTYLNQTLTSEEYNMVVSAFHELGFHKGWLQEPSSHATYRPNFENNTPFEELKL